MNFNVGIFTAFLIEEILNELLLGYVKGDNTVRATRSVWVPEARYKFLHQGLSFDSIGPRLSFVIPRFGQILESNTAQSSFW